MSKQEYQKRLSKEFDFGTGERLHKCISRVRIPCGKHKDPQLSQLFRGNLWLLDTLCKEEPKLQC